MILYQKMIFRSDLQYNDNLMYLFGDNAERFGMGGQAAEMRGEPNANGIATKWAPNNDPSAFFDDAEYSKIMGILLDDFQPVWDLILDGGTIVIPSDGLGTGLSQLPTKAPKVNKGLEQLLEYTTMLDWRINGEPKE